MAQAHSTFHLQLLFLLSPEHWRTLIYKIGYLHVMVYLHHDVVCTGQSCISDEVEILSSPLRHYKIQTRPLRNEPDIIASDPPIRPCGSGPNHNRAETSHAGGGSRP